jgi:glycerol-3-phosphate cytidylyltransferase
MKNDMDNKKITIFDGCFVNAATTELHMKKYKTIICYGTFDLFHYGHLQLLKNVNELIDRENGGKLIVGVSSDEYNIVKKGKTPIIDCKQRCEILKSIKYVDDVFVNEKDFDKRVCDIQKYNANAIVVDEKYKKLCEGVYDTCDVLSMPRTDGISTTDIKKIIKATVNDNL